MDDLLDCSRYGELEDIRLYLDHTATSPSHKSTLASAKGRFGNTMIHMAAANGHLHVLEYLISVLSEPVAVYVNEKNDEGNTALHWASLNGHLNAVEYLLKHGADPQIKNNAGHTALYGAEMGDKKEVAEKLLEYYNEDEDEEDSDEEELEGTSTARQTEEETGR